MPPSQERVEVGPAVVLDEKKRAAAQKLLAFLIKTGRFGTMAHDTKHKKDRPNEIKVAQRALGVEPDGIVGPQTTAAAAAVGVALPPRPY
jgi:murein L,D-transpeptidase YcbB/YkuD